MEGSFLNYKGKDKFNSREPLVTKVTIFRGYLAPRVLSVLGIVVSDDSDITGPRS